MAHYRHMDTPQNLSFMVSLSNHIILRQAQDEWGNNRAFRGTFIILLLIFTIGLAWPQRALAADADWKRVTDGIQYKKIQVDTAPPTENVHSSGTIHVFKIDPVLFKFDVVTARQFGMANIDAKTMARKTGALITINGGFFSPEYASLGLLVQGGQELNPLKLTSWWYIFQMNGPIPKIVTKQDYKITPDIEMAIEAGPRLVIDGNIPTLKPSSAERSAIGITYDGKVIIAATERVPLSLNDFAVYLKNLDCQNALNLDGGSSTQLYAKIKDFELNRPSIASVANGIGVFQR